jgi:hypothetical protein
MKTLKGALSYLGTASIIFPHEVGCDMTLFCCYIQDPIIDQVNHAVQKLTHATNFMQFLGQHALIVQEDAESESEDLVGDQSYHFMSLVLNLVNTFLYMVNTYIIVPTADDYAVSLGAAATVCGIIIGSMAVAQVFSSVYFSAWSNKSYFKPLVFSSIMLFLGNLLYALAYDLNSLIVLLTGRLLCGYAIFSIHSISFDLRSTFVC